MTVILMLLLWGMALLLFIPCLVLFIECLAACLPAHHEASATEKRSATVAVLMPAHNEATVIEKTITNLLPQLQKSDRLVVIADNCIDQTADLARQLGVTVIERQNLEQRGKGYALDYALQFLKADPPDVVIVIDADMITATNSIDELANMCYASGRPVQGIDLLEPPSNPSAKETISALAFLVKNRVRSTGLSRLGLPCLLCGTGMAIPWSILQQVSLNSGNIVEDMQLGVDLAIAGYPALFCPNAKVTGTFPSVEQIAKTQRTRWEHGHLNTLLTQVPRLLKAAISQKRLDLLSLALELGVPPLSFLVLLWGIAIIIGLLAGIISGIWLPVFLIILAGLLLFVAILMAWYRFGRPMIEKKALLSIPFYLVWKIPLYFAFLIRPENKWIKTQRDNLS
ncbi:glycosyl transferase [Aphanothece hegewaldii CCALA 016]|uniref:Glycosyl transferase n=1 Tax=Aphanothece hegewaldii CCALA 016 TaxID=2107694 RepID=A0A2T1LWA4_9CHRO|nr:glycosyltransferase family 2 protein [Aphanothece hegewaldii]PSF36181.1 glycosyl transferase [Aphanothece hegewaldii CCALA 016]